MSTTKVTTPVKSAAQMPAPMASLRAIMWICWFAFREMGRRRRLISLGAINLLPVMVVLGIRIWLPDEGITAHQQLASLSYRFFTPFLIPVVAMAVGVSAIGEQVEEGTIVYMWTRPIRRRAIFLGRLLAAQLVSSSLLVGSLALCFLVMVSDGLGVITGEFIKLYLTTFSIIVLGAFSYCAVFAAMGTWFKKPVLPAILFAFVWEGMVSEIPARVQELSLRFHLSNLMPQPTDIRNDLPGFISDLLSSAMHREPVPEIQSVAVLIATTLVGILAGVWLLRMKEIDK